MSDITTVPLQTADFLLGRLMATAKINDQLNAKIKELDETILRQRKYLEIQGDELKASLEKLKNLKTKPKRRGGRPLGSKNKPKVNP